MKLIIDVPENEYRHIKEIYEKNDIVEATYSYIYHGTPLEQEPKTGHWIQTNEFFINQDGQFIYKFICSECNSLSYFRKSNKKAIGANVCPNCGAKMVEPQESCDTCKHKDEEWDSEPCDGCCGNHSGFEPQEVRDKK